MCGVWKTLFYRWVESETQLPPDVVDEIKNGRQQSELIRAEEETTPCILVCFLQCLSLQ